MTLTIEPALHDVLTALQQRLAEQLPLADSNGRLAGRPITIRPVDRQTIEVIFREVPQVSETEVRAVRRIVDLPTFCTVSPESESTLTVVFICRLT
jgi:hypothetical protein